MVDCREKKEATAVSSPHFSTQPHRQVRECLQTTLENMKLSYLDLYLIASPCGVEEGGDLAPMDDKGWLYNSGWRMFSKDRIR